MKSNMQTICRKMNMFKIQTTTNAGWADLKFSDDSGAYEVCTYQTKEEAERELQDILTGCDSSKDEYRIVPIGTEAQCDIYTDSKIEIGDWVVTLDDNFGGYVRQISDTEAYIDFGSSETGWESLSNLRKG